MGQLLYSAYGQKLASSVTAWDHFCYSSFDSVTLEHVYLELFLCHLVMYLPQNTSVNLSEGCVLLEDALFEMQSP